MIDFHCNNIELGVILSGTGYFHMKVQTLSWRGRGEEVEPIAPLVESETLGSLWSVSEIEDFRNHE